jgi:type IV secretory pathway VirB3-like protein
MVQYLVSALVAAVIGLLVNYLSPGVNSVIARLRRRQASMRIQAQIEQVRLLSTGPPGKVVACLFRPAMLAGAFFLAAAVSFVVSIILDIDEEPSGSALIVAMVLLVVAIWCRRRLKNDPVSSLGFCCSSQHARDR